MVKKEIYPAFQIKGSYKLSYTIDKKPNELTVEVELKLVEGMLKPKQNVYEGFAIVNGSPYNKEDLSHCVNARLGAESIGKTIRNEIMKKCKEDKKVFKIKNDK